MKVKIAFNGEQASGKTLLSHAITKFLNDTLGHTVAVRTEMTRKGETDEIVVDLTDADRRALAALR